MDNKTEKALTRIKEIYAFSPQYENFASLFWEGLDRSRTEAAIEILLRVLWAQLEGEGARWEQLLERSSAQDREKLSQWLQTQSKRKERQ